MRKTIIELFAEFIDECRYTAKLAAATINGYEASFKLLTKIIPGIDLTMLSPKTINEFFKLLELRKRVVGRGQIKRGVKKTTIATYWSKLNSYMKWLEKNGHIAHNPFNDLNFPYVDYQDRKYLKSEDVQKIFTAVDFTIQWENSFIKKRNLLLMMLFLTCGLRKRELLGLTMLDIDLNRKQLTVRAETSKSRINRVVPLNLQVIPLLKDYIQERQQRAYKTTGLFVSDDNDHNFTEHGLKHLLEKIIKFSGVKFHVHQLRHTFAVNLINGGTDISKLKQLLGHRDIRMTAAYLRQMPTDCMRNDVEALRLDNLI